MEYGEDRIWVAFSEEEIIARGFEEELEVAKKEIKSVSAAGIFQAGPVWTELWYQYGLSWLDEDQKLVAIPDEADSSFVAEALRSPEGFDMLATISASFFRCGRCLPEPLKEFVISVLERKVERPKRRGPPPSANVWIRDFMILYAAHTLRSRYEIDLTRNAATVGVAASDIIVNVLRATYGSELSLGTVQNILSDEEKRRKHKAIRELYWSSILDDLD